ncbi:Ltp family lipoprotein [Microbacterium trichothecenolyticum]|uniref:Ltp family lipoprotein n=1 Tax=Microbacterium trichothecenolyticum TaxID=69370 RepID=UPI0035BE595C
MGVLCQIGWWAWVLIGLGALILLIIIIGSINAASGGSGDAKPAVGNEGFTQESKRPTVSTETITVPDLVGLTIAEARVELAKVGVELLPSEAADDWVVTTQQPRGGSEVTEAEIVSLSITSEAPKPVYTLAQQNAIEEAKDYLAFSGFSRSGLISQLEYEGYSTEDATFGVDNAGADWNAEAAESAADYLEYSSFSRQGLYDQLAYEGFSDAEIQYGLSQVGY